MFYKCYITTLLMHEKTNTFCYSLSKTINFLCKYFALVNPLNIQNKLVIFLDRLLLSI